MAWSVESLPSKPAALVRFSAELEILISILGLGVHPLFISCDVSSGGSDFLLTTDSERPALVYV